MCQFHHVYRTHQMHVNGMVGAWGPQYKCLPSKRKSGINTNIAISGQLQTDNCCGRALPYRLVRCGRCERTKAHDIFHLWDNAKMGFHWCIRLFIDLTWPQHSPLRETFAFRLLVLREECMSALRANACALMIYNTPRGLKFDKIEEPNRLVTGVDGQMYDSFASKRWCTCDMHGPTKF